MGVDTISLFVYANTIQRKTKHMYIFLCTQIFQTLPKHVWHMGCCNTCAALYTHPSVMALVFFESQSKFLRMSRMVPLLTCSSLSKTTKPKPKSFARSEQPSLSESEERRRRDVLALAGTISIYALLTLCMK